MQETRRILLAAFWGCQTRKMSLASFGGWQAVSNQNTQQALALPKEEVIQPHLPVRLPCYDFTPVTSPAFGIPLLAVEGNDFGHGQLP